MHMLLFFKLPFLIIVINSFRQPRLTLTNARTSAVEIAAAAAFCKAYTVEAATKAR